MIRNGILNCKVGNGNSRIAGLRARVWTFLLFNLRACSWTWSRACSLRLPKVDFLNSLMTINMSQVNQAVGTIGMCVDELTRRVRAVGHDVYGPMYKESILEAVRKQAEYCDSLQSFFIIGSLGGGTGSGLGSYIWEILRDEYPSVYQFATSICPSKDDDVVTSPYNR